MTTPSETKSSDVITSETVPSETVPSETKASTPKTETTAENKKADDKLVGFDNLALPDTILKAMVDLGYETPSPIQEQCIPLILAGGDLIGQAQTGTGKTGAFALPTLTNVDVKIKSPQVCVICPTRELAIQVAEAFSSYAKYINGLVVLPIYGGQPYPTQLRQLQRGVQVVVGTPGRIMDHMRRGNLDWKDLKTLVLDEADEMLRMGFMEDVEWILQHTPDQRQIALFSATMPSQIKRIAEKFLNKPKHVQIKSKAKTASTIEQQYITVSQGHKLDALMRVLESEPFEAVIVFTRTKRSCDELANKLGLCGFAAEAIHGDMQQSQRERIIAQLKEGKIDIVIATDVAARGLDVERISHVINYDIPQDAESYVHRIGRTGRAGRTGKAILFVTPREQRLLKTIEHRNGAKIERFVAPTIETINDNRTQVFVDQVFAQITANEHAQYTDLIEKIQQKHNQSGVDLAAALASLLFKDKPLLLDKIAELPEPKESRKSRQESRYEERSPRGRERGNNRDRGNERGDRGERRRNNLSAVLNSPPTQLKGQKIRLQRYVMTVGKKHGVTPRNIVGAIANEGDLSSSNIGEINLFDDISTVDLPSDMSNEVLSILQKARVCGRPMQLKLAKQYKEDTPSAPSKRDTPYKGTDKGPRKAPDRDRGGRRKS